MNTEDILKSAGINTNANGCKLDVTSYFTKDMREGLAWLLDTLLKITANPEHASCEKANNASKMLLLYKVFAEGSHSEAHNFDMAMGNLEKIHEENRVLKKKASELEEELRVTARRLETLEMMMETDNKN